jgi:Transposase IS116/IS110/IS902 family
VPALRRGVRRQVARWDAVHPWQKIIDAVFAACADPAGVTELRHSALECAGLLLADWRDTQGRLADTGPRMVTVLDKPGLTELVTSITGLSAVGVATILAERGDPARFTCGRTLAVYAGLALRQKSSGRSTSRTRMTGQGARGGDGAFALHHCEGRVGGHAVATIHQNPPLRAGQNAQSAATNMIASEMALPRITAALRAHAAGGSVTLRNRAGNARPTAEGRPAGPSRGRRQGLRHSSSARTGACG